MDAITSFSFKPLRLCFAMSSFSCFTAVVLAMFTTLSGSPLHSIGFGVAAAVFAVGGMLLLCLGVLGEYLGRVYDEVRNRPLSIINEVYSASDMMPAYAGMENEQAERVTIPGSQVAFDLKYPAALTEQEVVQFPILREDY